MPASVVCSKDKLWSPKMVEIFTPPIALLLQVLLYCLDPRCLDVKRTLLLSAVERCKAVVAAAARLSPPVEGIVQVVAIFGRLPYPVYLSSWLVGHVHASIINPPSHR